MHVLPLIETFVPALYCC